MTNHHNVLPGSLSFLATQRNDLSLTPLTSRRRRHPSGYGAGIATYAGPFSASRNGDTLAAADIRHRRIRGAARIGAEQTPQRVPPCRSPYAGFLPSGAARIGAETPPQRGALHAAAVVQASPHPRGAEYRASVRRRRTCHGHSAPAARGCARRYPRRKRANRLCFALLLQRRKNPALCRSRPGRSLFNRMGCRLRRRKGRRRQGRRGIPVLYVRAGSG